MVNPHLKPILIKSDFIKLYFWSAKDLFKLCCVVKLRMHMHKTLVPKLGTGAGVLLLLQGLAVELSRRSRWIGSIAAEADVLSGTAVN